MSRLRKRINTLMWDRLLVEPDGKRPLQAQVRSLLVSAISRRLLQPGGAVPSCREMAETLGVARNTVALAYDQLVDQGLLTAKARSGYYVSAELPAPEGRDGSEPGVRAPDWASHLAVRAAEQRNIAKPADWQKAPYPFLYGQFDPSLFPIAAWRECCRQALSTLDVLDWAPDLVDGDDGQLIEQIRVGILPRRGVFARSAEVMMTVGAQHALFLLAELLTRPGTVVGVEDPGYPDARNIFELKGCRVRPLPVDAGGLVVGDHLRGCAIIAVTPSHQCPTTRTMPLERRLALLDFARAHDIILIEDDYESEMNGSGGAMPALKSLDRDGRVVYVGSVSKILAPGLRLGYLVGAEAMMRQARALRRLMVRHPPLNNQRALALFLSLGHYEAFSRSVSATLEARSAAVSAGLARHLPSFSWDGGQGRSSVWLRGPAHLDARALAASAEARGVLIEPGDVFFAGDAPPGNFIRLGFASIPTARIDAGLARLAEALREVT